MIAPKSYDFALRIIKLYKWMIGEHKEYVLSKQLLRSGTAVGALVKEAEHAQSKADFLELIKLLVSIVKSTKSSLNK